MTIKSFLPALAALLVMTTAACAEAQQQLPAPVQALQERGIQIVGTFDAPGGLTGYAGLMGRRPVAIYLTSDGQHAILGSMVNGKGEFVNRDTLQQMVAEPMSKRVWTQLKDSNWVGEGASDAPRTVYVFSDPNCPYCYAFWKQARPWIESGKVELRHILVGVISETSDNKVATILTADNPEQMLVKNKKQYPEGGIEPMEHVPAKVQAKLTANMQLMRQLGFRGTPSIVYRDDQGNVQFQVGVPSKSAMEQILGPRPDGQ